MREEIPPRAEKIELIKCTKFLKRPSQFCKGLDAIVEEFKCPSCEEVQERPAFDTVRSCPKCNLRMSVSGLFVSVWFEKNVAAPALVPEQA